MTMALVRRSSPHGDARFRVSLMSVLLASQVSCTNGTGRRANAPTPKPVAVVTPVVATAQRASPASPAFSVRDNRPITSATYDLGPQSVMSAPSHQARIRGFASWPSDLKPQEKAPIALIVHGNNGVCRFPGKDDRCNGDHTLAGKCPAGTTPTPNAEGFIWLAKRLAKAGWIAVSIDANSVNCVGLPIIVQGRAQLLVAHLRFWRFWHTNRHAPNKALPVAYADLSRVALLGHSNGAEAAARASMLIADKSWEPDLKGVDVGAVVSLASSDSVEAFARDAAMLHVTASCDGQLPDHSGVRILDRSLQDRRSTIVQAVLPTMSHNGFNDKWGKRESEREGWVPCPGVKIADGGQVRSTTAALIVPFLRATVQQPAAIPSWLFGDGEPPAGVARNLDVRLHGHPERHLLLERFSDLRTDQRGLLGGAFKAHRLRGGVCFGDNCSPTSPNVTWATRVEWQGDGAAFIQELPPTDFSQWKTISMRIVPGPLGTVKRTVPMRIGLRDSKGRGGLVRLDDVRTARLLPRYATADGKSDARPDMMVAVRVPIREFLRHQHDLDLRHITSVDLVFEGDARKQSLVIADIELTNP
ncbi:MAG: hypothetical protein KC502_19165 [Myxococcales bacterium]|nr:hypothetical protein [Myxococcales bacterium]